MHTSLFKRRNTEEIFWGAAKLATWIFFLVFVFLPILWLILTSFKISKDAYSTKLLFEPTLNNFKAIFRPPMSFAPLVVNSIVVSFVAAVVGVIVGVFAAYAFSRYKFRTKNLLIVCVLSSQFVPPVVIALPFFNVYRQLSLLDTRIGLILLNLSFTLPFAIWLLKGFIDELPGEIEEAGLIDGCSYMQLLRYVSIPLIMPGIITSFAFCFVQSWNEFMFALIMTRRNAVTLTVGLMSLDSEKGILWEQMSAAGLLIMVPIFVLSLSIRKYFIAGISMGSVKS